MEYTKGEWEKHAYGNGNFYIEASGRQVATIHYYPTDKSDEIASTNTQLIIEAVNQCIDINPDNPLNVAQSIKQMYEALKGWDKLRAMHPLDSGADIDDIFWGCCKTTDKALSKARSK